MPASFSFRQIAALVLLSTVCVISRKSSAQKPANPTPGPKTSAENSATQKPQPKPDESAPASAALLQINNALEGLAAKVSPAVVQILVTGYGSVHEENRAQTALIVRQNAVGSGVILDPAGYIIT